MLSLCKRAGHLKDMWKMNRVSCRISVQVVNRLDSCHWNPLLQIKEWDMETEVRCCLKETRKWVIQEEQCSPILSTRKDQTLVEEADDKVLSYVVTHHFTSKFYFIPSYLCSISVLWNQYKKKGTKLVNIFTFFLLNIFQMNATCSNWTESSKQF